MTTVMANLSYLCGWLQCLFFTECLLFTKSVLRLVVCHACSETLETIHGALYVT